ncbi:adenylate/guanylate cyclase domain-containing protein [Mycobacterium sp.]|uniref:adenylate/guanylate cyclase domain-containing protein n=1 Tax=Mycobacterium sp. TaxID=1785 RepID=UPI003A8784A8
MEVGPVDSQSPAPGESAATAGNADGSTGDESSTGDDGNRTRRRRSPAQWLRITNRSPRLVEFVKRVRRSLPGDPEFGDPLSAAGEGGPRAAARAANRILWNRDGASREVSLGVLQVWQAMTEAASGQPANPEVTLVFTDLVGFSSWALEAGDDATLTLLRQVARAVEPPLLDSGGQIVKRMGDGIMAVFRHPGAAVRAVFQARQALKSVEVNGYTPRMRAGIHTGRPQRLGSDWLGVDVNIAARVMERATKGGVMISSPTLDLIGRPALEAMGVTAGRARRPVFSSKVTGIPPDLQIYRIKNAGESPTGASLESAPTQAH